LDVFYDNTYWVPGFGSRAFWDGSEWDSVLQSGTYEWIQLAPITSGPNAGWNTGYDPQSVTITLGNIGGGGSDVFDLRFLFSSDPDITELGIFLTNGVPYIMDLSSGGSSPNLLWIQNAGTLTGTFSLVNLVFNRF
jgi:hypothetical protein